MADLESLVDSTDNSFFDMLLKYGLFAGAIFQIICIFSVVFIPSSEEEKVCYKYVKHH